MFTFTEILFYIAFITIIVSSTTVVFKYYYKLSPILIGANHKWDKKTDNFNLTFGILVAFGAYFTFYHLVTKENKVIIFYLFLFFSFLPVLKKIGEFIKKSVFIENKDINFDNNQFIHFKEEQLLEDACSKTEENLLSVEKSIVQEVKNCKNEILDSLIELNDINIKRTNDGMNTSLDQTNRIIEKHSSVENLNQLKKNISASLKNTNELTNKESIINQNKINELNNTLLETNKLISVKPTKDDLNILKDVVTKSINDSREPIISEIFNMKSKITTRENSFIKQLENNKNEIITSQKMEFRSLIDIISSSNKNSEKTTVKLTKSKVDNKNKTESIPLKKKWLNRANIKKLSDSGIFLKDGSIITDKNLGFEMYHLHFLALGIVILEDIQFENIQKNTFIEQFLTEIGFLDPYKTISPSTYNKFTRIHRKYMENIDNNPMKDFTNGEKVYLEKILNILKP